jgi:hypothetical protein
MLNPTLILHNNKINVKGKIRRKHPNPALLAAALQLQHQLQRTPQTSGRRQCQDQLQRGGDQEVTISCADQATHPDRIFCFTQLQQT